jgi:hypothetical protein
VSANHSQTFPRKSEIPDVLVGLNSPTGLGEMNCKLRLKLFDNTRSSAPIRGEHLTFANIV